MTKKAFFLDRDGVINVDYGYVYKREDFQFVDGIFELCRHAISNSYLIFVITNQSGIGRGHYSLSDFDSLTTWMCEEFLTEGVLITKVYYSPFHPTHGLGEYKKDDVLRKPRSGMIYQAINEFCIDLNDSVLIGDKPSDIHAGINAGVGTNIYIGDNQICKNLGLTCHSIASLSEAKQFL